MAKNGQSKQLPEFFKAHLTQAQKRFHALETEAEHALKNLVARGRESREELEALLERVNKGELHWPDAGSIKQIGKRAGAAGVHLRRRLDVLQNKVIETAGVASQSQFKALNRELNKLTKKVDQLISKKAKVPELRA